jgi:hypothetical protein
MATIQQKAQCMLWYVEFKSSMTVQCNFQCIYRQKHLLTDQFREIESVEKKKSTERPQTSEEIVERIIHTEYIVWGTQHPNKFSEYECDIPKVNTWCGLLLDCSRTFLPCGKNHYWGNLPG